MKDQSAPDASSRWVPRLLALYRDVVDDEAAAVSGWELVCWGFEIERGGAACTIHVDERPHVTTWHCVQDAIDELDVFVDVVQPRRSWDSSEGGA